MTAMDTEAVLGRRATPIESTDDYSYKHPGGNPERDEVRRIPAIGHPSNRAMGDLLDEVRLTVTGDRQRAYGDPSVNHGCTAEMWTAYLKRKGKLVPDMVITARDVCMMNAAQKISRDANMEKRDNLIDLAGYAANASACSAKDAANGT